MSFLPVEEQLAHIKRGSSEIVPEKELVEKLEESFKTRTPLRVKLGCDPSRPDLHIGHAVVLRKLRQFQDLGHIAVLIIGDFTAMIGDPSGKSKTRPALTVEQTREYGQTYFEQAAKILDQERLEIHYNSDWLGEMSFSDVIKLASNYTVARMLERDDFEKRYKNNTPISVHEFMYPLAQAYDSVAIKSDIELGGTDQKFNLLVGRDIQQAHELKQQICLTLPILEGTDGVNKMSKSLDNYIGISESAKDMYGKTVSIPDDLIYRYFELATDLPTEELAAIKKYAKEDPRNAKHDLALRIASMYHGKEEAERARLHFENTIIKGETPDDIEEFSISGENGLIGLLSLMVSCNLAKSNGEARRLVEQNAVSIEGEKWTDPRAEINLGTQKPFVIKVGKRRFAKVV